MKLFLLFLRDEIIERSAQFVGIDPVWFCLLVVGLILLGIIVWSERALMRNKRGLAGPSKAAEPVAAPDGRETA